MKAVRLALAGALSLILMALGATLALAQDKREITHIAGDLYRVQNKFHYSVFLVTDDGVIATDPVNAEAAAWLEAEIRKRFGKEITYLILSHDHRDHSSGGEVWDDTAVVVAHANARDVIIGEARPTAVPEITFSDTLTIDHGGKTVDLYYFGPSHSDNLIVMRFPEERALYAVDIVSVGAVPFRDLPDSHFPGWIGVLDAAAQLDFDILVPGHGPMGTKADLRKTRDYLAELHDEVLAGMRAGKTLDQLKATITMDAYHNLSRYEAWRPLNVEGMHKRLSLHRRGN